LLRTVLWTVGTQLMSWKHARVWHTRHVGRWVLKIKGGH
jgi:hypothetical protein